jgi:oxalate decarboxylase/phosphoglucose isomerase-like protein (cupin superfamily)
LPQRSFVSNQRLISLNREIVNSDGYILKGAGRATVFNTGPAAITANFHAGDIGYITKAFGHYLENTGNTDLVYMEVFRADRFEEVSLSDWLARSRSTWCPRP